MAGDVDSLHPIFEGQAETAAFPFVPSWVHCSLSKYARPVQMHW